MDIVLWTAKFRALLDVRMFHMMVARGSTLAHEQLKHNRYPTRHSDGRRLVNGIFVPVVVNTVGGVGSAAADFFSKLQLQGPRDREPSTNVPRSRPAKSLTSLVSALGVYLAAEQVFFAHAPSPGSAAAEYSARARALKRARGLRPAERAASSPPGPAPSSPLLVISADSTPLASPAGSGQIPPPAPVSSRSSPAPKRPAPRPASPRVPSPPRSRRSREDSSPTPQGRYRGMAGMGALETSTVGGSCGSSLGACRSLACGHLEAEKHEFTTERITERTTEHFSVPVTEPIIEPSSEQLARSIIEPTIDPITEPIAKAIAESNTEPSTERHTQTITEPISAEPIIEQIAKPNTERHLERRTITITEPFVDPNIESIIEPLANPDTEISGIEPLSTHHTQHSALLPYASSAPLPLPPPDPPPLIPLPFVAMPTLPGTLLPSSALPLSASPSPLSPLSPRSSASPRALAPPGARLEIPK